MSKRPWQVPDTKQTTEHRQPYQEVRPSGLTRLIVFVLGIVMLLFGLSLAFPMTGIADPYLVRALIIILIFGGAAAFWSRSSLWRLAKVAGLWIAIIAGVTVFYLYRSDLGERFMSSVDPAGVINTEEGHIVHRAKDGHFWLRAEMNGVPVLFMVDTGASHVVLSPEDAKRIGLNPSILNFNRRAETANGPVQFAKATVTSMRLGETEFFDLPVTVNGADMQGSLLGMAVLQKFASVEFRGDKLILRP